MWISLCFTYVKHIIVYFCVFFNTSNNKIGVETPRLKWDPSEEGERTHVGNSTRGKELPLVLCMDLSQVLIGTLQILNFWMPGLSSWQKNMFWAPWQRQWAHGEMRKMYLCLLCWTWKFHCLWNKWILLIPLPSSSLHRVKVKVSTFGDWVCHYHL